MNDIIDNSGVMNTGSGLMRIKGSPVGHNAAVNIYRQQSKRSASKPSRRWDIGIVTILPEEAKAVQGVFGLELDNENRGRQPFYAGTVRASGRSVRIVAARTMQQGQGSVIPTLDNLRRCYDPAVLVLLGIGGGIHGDLALDDVVIATRVVFYDMRQVTPKGVLRRGEEHQSPASMIHAVNSFFTKHHDPAELTVHEAESRTFRVFCGPIGSGNAVIADGGDEIRNYLVAYNEKILAVDTEAGALSQFCHETSSPSGAITSWVVIRGISDHADRTKNDDHHVSSAMNAAHTLWELIPYIRPN